VQRAHSHSTGLLFSVFTATATAPACCSACSQLQPQYRPAVQRAHSYSHSTGLLFSVFTATATVPACCSACSQLQPQHWPAVQRAHSHSNSTGLLFHANSSCIGEGFQSRLGTWLRFPLVSLGYLQIGHDHCPCAGYSRFAKKQYPPQAVISAVKTALLYRLFIYVYICFMTTVMQTVLNARP
jgi:hypothetical protein